MKNKIFLAILISILFLTGCSAKNITPAPTKNMSDKKILIVVAPFNFRDVEYSEPRKIFEENGAIIKVASIQRGTAKGADGMEVDINLTAGEINVEDFDAVVFSGGPGMIDIADDESLTILANKFYNANKITAAICSASAVLANAGILQNKQATSWEGVKAILEKNGATYTGDKVTRDGIIITADGPSSVKEFGEAIMNALK